MLTVNVTLIYDVITVDYCKCILLYSPMNSYLYVHWILDFKLNIIIKNQKYFTKKKVKYNNEE